MFATVTWYVAKKPKPKMKPIELKTPPEQRQTITRTIFNTLTERGPLTIADTWEHVKKLRQICNHVGPHKQFLYTTWFAKPDGKQTRLPELTLQDQIHKHFTNLGLRKLLIADQEIILLYHRSLYLIMLCICCLTGVLSTTHMVSYSLSWEKNNVFC